MNLLAIVGSPRKNKATGILVDNAIETLPYTYYCETFRIIGFPAIVEHHFKAGIGFKLTGSFSLDLGFVYAVEESISENGTDPFGTPVTLESTLNETSFDFGLTYKF
jgi:long-chain fatty acid transport protein